MNGDTHADDEQTPTHAATRGRHGVESFRPATVRDRFERHVRDDHATNATLHATLQSAYSDDPTVSVNLMGSHAPGEKDHEPRYHVRLSVENGSMGEPSTGETLIDRMVERGDVVITKAYGGARYDDVDVPDGSSAPEATKQTIHESVDRITVHVRPVETRVEPIEVPVSAIPGNYVEFDGVVDDVTHDAAVTLRTTVDEYGVDHERTQEAARALSTVVYCADPDRYTEYTDEPEAAPHAAYKELWRRAGVDPKTNEVSNRKPVAGGGFEWEAEEDDRTRDLVDAIRDPGGRIVDGETFPQTRPPEAALRSWVTRQFPEVDDVDKAARKIADAVENHVIFGTVWGGDHVFEFDADKGTSSIPCGCGDYAVEVPEGSQPPSIDVVCPECGNHFGHDGTDDAENVSYHDIVGLVSSFEDLAARYDNLSAGVTDETTPEEVAARVASDIRVTLDDFAPADFAAEDGGDQ